MSKMQKTFYLNRDLDQSITIVADGRGSSFTRLVTCALLASLANGFLHDPSNDVPMRATMQLERGEASLDEALQMIRKGTK